MILHGHNIYICFYSAGSIESDIHFKMSGKRGTNPVLAPQALLIVLSPAAKSCGLAAAPKGGEGRGFLCHKKSTGVLFACAFLQLGAENGARTRDPQLGKLMLYQLSYFRVAFIKMIIL